MAATSIAYRVVDNRDGTFSAEIDVEHRSTDATSLVDTSALAYARKFSDARGKTITKTGATYSHTSFTSGGVAMRRSTVRYRFS